ncbi:MAG TPA: SAM-dependent methyltransferase [Solirubrobacteraceae bacterium]|nr:SAM-dependent methyltransferase [Solirubrobacteraceae bacterium]
MSSAARFDEIYARSEDPWDYETSAYEREKYAATLAALPQGPVASALELGCSIGAFTQLLAERCERVLALDFSERALALARKRLSETRNVELRQARFPDEAPDERFRVVLCSEILYYLKAPALAQAIGWLAEQLLHGSSVLVVSWRGVGREEPFLGDEVHDRLVCELGLWHAFDGRQEGYRLDRFDPR